MKKKLKKLFFDPIKLPEIVKSGLRIFSYISAFIVVIITFGNLYETIQNSDDIFDLKYDSVKPLEDRVEQLENSISEDENSVKDENVVIGLERLLTYYDGYTIEVIGCPEGTVLKKSYLKEGFMECILPEFAYNDTHIPFIQVKKVDLIEHFSSWVRTEIINSEEVNTGPRVIEECDTDIGLEGCMPALGVYDYEETEINGYSVISYNTYGVSGSSKITIVEMDMNIFILNNHWSAQCDEECYSVQNEIYDKFVGQFTSSDESLIFLK